MTDLAAAVGRVVLPNPVMTASGTSGHGAELGAFGNLGGLGCVVVKSLAAFAWEGNPPPRVAPTAAGMLNSVGLTGSGVTGWREAYLSGLVDAGARVVVSIWGRNAADYGLAAELLAGSPPAVVAVEVNVSCPNGEDRGRMFAQSPAGTHEVIAAVVAATQLPVWAKLSPAVADVTEIAGSALAAGAEALTLVNTLVGMAIDVDRRVPVLGGVSGGLSGPALHPVAVRCVYECRAAFPDAAIVGVGGVTVPAEAIELIMAGANAVQVGTATFVDPRAPWKILKGIEKWCRRQGVERLADLVGVAHA